MQALLKLSRGIDRLNALVGRYVIWLILASTLISAGNALVRKIFNVEYADIWQHYDELSGTLGAEVVLCFHSSGHLHIFYGRFPLSALFAKHRLPPLFLPQELIIELIHQGVDLVPAHIPADPPGNDQGQIILHFVHGPQFIHIQGNDGPPPPVQAQETFLF